MKVSELIMELEDFKDEYGDLPVKIYADHGQVHMTAGQVSLSYTEDVDEYMSESVNPDDVEDGNTKVCEVS
ncbi:hypothetical protein VP14_106 [Vibrio phage VPMCC14]|nr:hypothetical protein VP14_106 [Vibrio phage VPMCC14]